MSFQYIPYGWCIVLRFIWKAETERDLSFTDSFAKCPQSKCCAKLKWGTETPAWVSHVDSRVSSTHTIIFFFLPGGTREASRHPQWWLSLLCCNAYSTVFVLDWILHSFVKFPLGDRFLTFFSYFLIFS